MMPIPFFSRMFIVAKCSLVRKLGEFHFMIKRRKPLCWRRVVTRREIYSDSLFCRITYEITLERPRGYLKFNQPTGASSSRCFLRKTRGDNQSANDHGESQGKCSLI